MCSEIQLLYGITVDADCESMLRRKEWGGRLPLACRSPHPRAFVDLAHLGVRVHNSPAAQAIDLFTHCSPPNMSRAAAH